MKQNSLFLELRENFDLQNAELRKKNEEIKIRYNVQDIESKFHRDVREHMDVLKVKIEMSETRKYRKKLSWSQLEVQRKMPIKEGKQPGKDRIKG